MITEELYQYTRELLAAGVYINKEVAELTGLGKNTVKDIDKERLRELYTTADGKLIKPEKPAKFLGIDEFKLHNGYRYATHIIDMETGHILWITGGKKKQVVYDFIEHVGLKWMEQVEAVACDIHVAYQAHQEDVTGSIEVGKSAELVLLDSDIESIPAEQIQDIKILETVFKGKTVFKHA